MIKSEYPQLNESPPTNTYGIQPRSEFMFPNKNQSAQQIGHEQYNQEIQLPIKRISGQGRGRASTLPTLTNRSRIPSPFINNVKHPQKPAVMQQFDGLDDEEEEEMLIKSSPGSKLNAYGVPSRHPSRNNSYSGKGSNLHDKIRVCVRKRPLSQKELTNGQKDIAIVNGIRSIIINEPK